MTLDRTVRAVDADSLPYRPCVGIMLVNPRGLVWVGRRRDTPGAWQMPQGGIDADETPIVAARRELREEVGTDKASPIAESKVWRTYDLPPELLGKALGGRYRGQTQKWFAFRFEGVDGDFDIARGEPEFEAWQWVRPDELSDLIVPFKRKIYVDVVEEFRGLIGASVSRER
jgi:putative (di)nucleoside polyphosphate hydrolase